MLERILATPSHHGRSAVAVLLVPAITLAVLLTGPAHPAAAATGNTVYLPNIVKMLGGPTGWQTPFIVQNVGTESTDLTVTFYDFTSGAVVAQRSVPGLRPGTSFADVPNNDSDLPAGGQFSVVVQSFGSPVVSVVNEHQGVGDRAEALSYVGLSEGATKVALPFVADDFNHWITTLIIQNVGTTSTSVSVRFLNLDGAGGTTVMRTIEPGRSQVIDPRTEPGLTAGVEYSALVTSGQPVAVVANSHDDAPGTFAPRGFSYNGVPATTASATFLPYVSYGSGTGKVYIENVGDADATPVLTLQPVGGGTPMVLRSSSPIPSGAGWQLNPLPGNFSLVVTGGRFAVLGAMIGPTTASGYTGTSSLSKRIFLPNVTRNLGGPSGWTTPIALQSAGATSVTLSWYRFSDGSLASTETRKFCTCGAAILVDPRASPDLTDNSQYSVVAVGDGPITADVLESAAGGDNSMAYESFPDPATAVPSGYQAAEAYLRTVGGYSYSRLSPESEKSFQTTYVSSAEVFTGMAVRLMSKGSTSAAVIEVLQAGPRLTSDPTWGKTLMAELGKEKGAQTMTISGATAVLWTFSSGKVLMWAQGERFVYLYGADTTAMKAIAGALINANK